MTIKLPGGSQGCGWMDGRGFGVVVGGGACGGGKIVTGGIVLIESLGSFWITVAAVGSLDETIYHWRGV